MQDPPVAIAEDDIDRITHSQGVNLRGANERKSFSGIQLTLSQQASCALTPGAGPPQIAGDLEARGGHQSEGHVE
jgi:hypothetical protein